MDQKKSDNVLLKVAICFFLSGMAALLYQTAWMRQLSVVFGTSELAVATVLTAYMFGLSLGAYIAGKYIHKITKPLLVYGLLEGGIAVAAVLVPFLLKLFDQLNILFLGGQSMPPEASGFGQLLFYFLSTLLVLVIPTALMGATLPLLSKFVVKNDQQVGTHIGGLYAINTFGAVAGTLFAAFILLPNISLFHTLLVGAVMNLGVLVLIMNIVKHKPEAETEDDFVEDQCLKISKESFFARNAWILPLMTVSGVATFTYEVLWTRLIGHILGGSVPAFAVMLASFLVGIAAGSAVASRFAKTQDQAKKAFVIAQLGIALFSAFTYYMIENSLPEQGGLFKNALLSFALILPSTLFIGATFPLAVRIFSENEKDAPSASAKVYAWNTIGAIFGATLAGFFLIPLLKYSGAIQIAVLVNLFLALLAIILISSNLRNNLGIKIASLLTFVLVFSLYEPAEPEKIVSFSPFSGINDLERDQVKYYDVGRSSTVLLFNQRNGYRLTNNGLPESFITKKGELRNRRLPTQMLSILPVIANPEAKSMLVAGFGGGVVVENLPPSIEYVDVVELEPKVIEANRAVANVRQFDPLADDRVNIIYNDARNALHLTDNDKKYDIIVSQPSHPWTAGASHLYTEEYIQLVEDHLEESGVFLQWMNTSFVDTYLLKSLSATLANVFDHVQVYQLSSRSLYFLASNKSLNIEQRLLEEQDSILSDDFYRSIGYASAETFLASLVMADSGLRRFSKLGRVITDDFNILGTRSALAYESKRLFSNESMTNLFLENNPLFIQDSWVYSTHFEKLNFHKIISELYLTNKPPIFIDKVNEILSKIKPEYFKGFRSVNLFQDGYKKQAINQVLEALGKYPNNQQFKYLLLTYFIDDQEISDIGWFENLPDEIKIHYDSLQISAKAVLHNSYHLNQQNYVELQKADEELKDSVLSDQWSGQAMQMRAFWKVKHARKTNDPKLAKEALAQLNQFLILRRSFDRIWVYDLRLDAALIANEKEVFLNSYNSLYSQLNSTLQRYRKPENVISENEKNESIQLISSIQAYLSEPSNIEIENIDQILKNLEILKQRFNELESYEKI